MNPVTAANEAFENKLKIARKGGDKKKLAELIAGRNDFVRRYADSLRLADKRDAAVRILQQDCHHGA
jgi:hypothetical protein